MLNIILAIAAASLAPFILLIIVDLKEYRKK
jgi:hypothetical protein